jgi:hypothetical protein
MEDEKVSRKQRLVVDTPFFLKVEARMGAKIKKKKTVPGAGGHMMNHEKTPAFIRSGTKAIGEDEDQNGDDIVIYLHAGVYILACGKAPGGRGEVVSRGKKKRIFLSF